VTEEMVVGESGDAPNPNEEYMQLQTLVVLLCRSINEMPLDKFLARIEKAMSVGPILDPTLYIAGSKHLARLERLAKALRAAQVEIRAVNTEIEKEKASP
jgi:hypothetical protein